MRPMLKSLFAIVLFFNTSIARGQRLSYDDWQNQAKDNIRLLPEYGHVQKTDEQKKLDENLIEEETKQEGTRHKASEHLISLGFNYLNRGDAKTAMYRFNQAWLLDPANDNVYWGFGAIYFSFNDYKKAQEQYDKGLKMNPDNANILTDKATIYLGMLQNKFTKENFNKALILFQKSYSIDPSNQNTTYKMSVLYFINDDCKNAQKYFEECKKQGGQPIDPEYEKAIKEKCGNKK